MMSLKTHIDRFIVTGYATRTHLLIDLDNTTLSKAQRLARMLMRSYPKIGDCLIVLSSQQQHIEIWSYTQRVRPTITRVLDNYHLIFDGLIGYNSCDQILKELVGVGVIALIADKLRGLRSCMTLRVSPKIQMIGIKPSPKPIHIIFNSYKKSRSGGIKAYLDHLYMVKSVFNQWHLSGLYPFQPQTHKT